MSKINKNLLFWFCGFLAVTTLGIYKITNNTSELSDLSEISPNSFTINDDVSPNQSSEYEIIELLQQIYKHKKGYSIKSMDWSYLADINSNFLIDYGKVKIFQTLNFDYVFDGEVWYKFDPNTLRISQNIFLRSIFNQALKSELSENKCSLLEENCVQILFTAKNIFDDKIKNYTIEFNTSDSEITLIKIDDVTYKFNSDDTVLEIPSDYIELNSLQTTSKNSEILELLNEDS